MAEFPDGVFMAVDVTCGASKRKTVDGTYMVLGKFFNRKSQIDVAHQLYVRLVEHARLPVFYQDGGVPDTVDGRFDMVVLHAFLVMRRLSQPGATENEARLSQDLFDVMFGDMDRNLREMGVGDLSVGGKVRTMAEAFYGRVAAYEAGLAEPGDARLIEALARNLYRHVDPALLQSAQTAMAAYMRREAAQLAATASGRLLQGEVVFGLPVFATGH